MNRSKLHSGVRIALTVVLFSYLSFILSVNVKGEQPASERLVTLSKQNVSLEKVFKEIGNQTGVIFTYNNDHIRQFKKVSCKFKNQSLKHVLDGLLEKRGLAWVAMNDSMVSIKMAKHNVFSASEAIDTATRITGVVIDEKGMPIPGATIIVKDLKAGTTTDARGAFSLAQVSKNAWLKISNISFGSTEVAIRGRNDLGRIVLKTYTGSLDEIVVKGYYNTTKRFNTGNVTSVQAEDIEKQPVTNPLLTLQARVPGLIVTQTTGVPGGDVKVQLRGPNSINSGTQPLVVIDGIPYELSIAAPPSGSFGAPGQALSALNFINPADIESIDVLKDADATSIYGSRGANGVILVTTKKGKAGPNKFNFDVHSGFSKLFNRRALLNTPEYLAMRREAFENDNEVPTIGNAADLKLWDTTRYTDWQKDLLGHTAGFTSAQFSFSGGNENAKFLFNTSYTKEGTVFPGSFHNSKGGLHVGLSGNSKNKRFSVSFTGSFLSGGGVMPGVDFASYTNLPPNTPVPYNADGSLNWASSTWDNPYGMLVSKEVKSSNTNLISNITAEYRLLPSLTLKATFGYNQLSINTSSIKKQAGTDPSKWTTEKPEVSLTNTSIRNLITEPQLTYDREIGNGKLSMLLGTTFNSRDMNSFKSYMGGFMADGLVNFPSAADINRNAGISSLYRYSALFGRVGYDLNNKYLLNLIFRRDGSSRFGDNKKLATFFAIGSAWIFSEENWFKNAFPFVNFGKLRGSYGITGNDQIGDYKYFDQYEFTFASYQGVRGLRSIGLFNPDYEWEKTRKAEFSLDAGFFNRIDISACYFFSRSDNQLSSRNLPVTAGAISIIGNLPATISNKGWEIVINTRNIETKKVSWSTSFNISTYRNKLTKYDGPDPSIRNNRSLNMVSVYRTNGPDPQTGMFTFADADGKITSAEAANIHQDSIDLTPSYYGGIENKLKIGLISIGISLQYTKVRALTAIYANDAAPGTMRNQPVQVRNRWHAPGDIADMQKLSQDGSLAESFNYWNQSNRAYGNASFIRCKNIYADMQMPKRLLNKLNVDNGSFYMSMQNAFTITNYPGWDPETRNPFVLPPLSTFTLGIKLTF